MTEHNTIRDIIATYYPEIAEKIKGYSTIKDAETVRAITTDEGNTIAIWLYLNNGEVEK